MSLMPGQRQWSTGAGPRGRAASLALPCVLAVLLVGACDSDDRPTDGGPRDQGGADLTASLDGGAPDLGPVDAALDLAPALDLVAVDLTVAPGGLVASLSGGDLFQSCQPIVPPDPARLTISIRFTNQGPSPIGPIAVSDGEIDDANKQQLATFGFAPARTAVIPPGQSATLDLEKTAGSLVPAQGCQTLKCGTAVVVVVPYDGPGVPANRSARSDALTVMCAF